MKKWIQNKLYKWLKKTDYHLPLPVLQTVIKPESLKRFHAEHIVPYYDWEHTQVEPDCFLRTFRFDLVNQLLNEIIVKVEQTPDGVKYSADLLFENI